MGDAQAPDASRPRTEVAVKLWSGLALAVALAAVAALSSAGGTGAVTAALPSSARAAAEPAPVASLEPAETNRLWRHLVATRSRRARATADCRPVRAVFYTATDFLRLATKLAATASPCAQYYISVPPLVADKTKPRPNAANRIRALGPNFHAMAEFHFATWTRWVASTGSSWYQAGVTLRERMAAAGYDVAKGDTWAVNELNSAVRRGTGNARANARELLRGLYEGGGQPVRGAVFVIGVAQRTADVSLYQTNLQSWYTDSAFWADMTTYVSDWSQEVYGDVRNYAVPGVPENERRDYLNDYLQHQIVLAGVGPASIETARSFLLNTSSPLANAAWERETGYGWTMVPPEQMGAYVSGQVHALRYFSATTGQEQDHWGFAWAPRNGSGASAADFAAKSGLVLDRLAAAIRDSADSPDPTDPGGAACGPPGQNVYCLVDLEGARLNEAWKSFRVWTQPVLGFATPPQTITAGTISAPISLALVTTTGLPITTRTPLAVTVSSSSATGVFAITPEGPWSTTLALSIPAGGRTSVPFYYQDQRAGTYLLTAAAGEDVTSGTQAMTVTPGPMVSLSIAPATASVPARGSQQLAAAGADSLGNSFPIAVSWSLTPAALGALSPTSGSATTFTARRSLGQGTIAATVVTDAGTFSATASVQVTSGRLRVEEITYRARNGTVLVGVSAVDTAGNPISHARISVLVRREGRRYLAGRAETGAAGHATYRMSVPRQGGCLTTTIRSISAPGFAWDGRTPRNGRCWRRPA
jgi:hypothetical protein